MRVRDSLRQREQLMSPTAEYVTTAVCSNERGGTERRYFGEAIKINSAVKRDECGCDAYLFYPYDVIDLTLSHAG